MTTTIPTNSNRRKAIADIHRMKTLLGMSDDEYRVMLSAWGVNSSKDLDDKGLASLRYAMHEKTLALHESSSKTLDVWRKRVYGVVGKWLDTCGYTNNAQAIRTIVCRATQRDNFNKIPASELKQVYHSWSRKLKIAQESNTLIDSLKP